MWIHVTFFQRQQKKTNRFAFWKYPQFEDIKMIVSILLNNHGKLLNGFLFQWNFCLNFWAYCFVNFFFLLNCDPSPTSPAVRDYFKKPFFRNDLWEVLCYKVTYKAFGECVIRIVIYFHHNWLLYGYLKPKIKHLDEMINFGWLWRGLHLRTRECSV